jgi:exopolysaccharide production protein ExoQ
MFSNLDKYAQQIQALGVSLICLTAALSVIHSLKFKNVVTGFDLIIFLMILLSFVSSVLNQREYVGIYTVIFLTTYLSIMLLCRVMNDEEIVFCVVLSIIVTLVVVAISYLGVLWQSLQPGNPNRWTDRFQPFNMHPDLTGYVYGGYIAVILFSNVSSGRFNVPLKVGAIAVCAMVSLAASARAGLVALLGLLVIHVVRSITLQGKNTKYVIFAAFIVAVLAFVFEDRIIGYLTEILELDSSYRGLGSGGSGRLELWQRGLSLIGDRTWELYIGSGLRSSEESILGFFTESSYISICIDSGIIVFILFVGYLVWLVFKLHFEEGRGNDRFGRLVFYCIVFAMLQSIFNRYLLAIGNPFSLIVLIFTSKIAVNQAVARRNAANRSRAALWKIKMRHPHPAS